MFIKVAITLFGSALISYVLIPMIANIAKWQSGGIFFCLVSLFIGLEIKRSAALRYDQVARVGQPQSPPAAEMTPELEAMVAQIRAFAQPPQQQKPQQQEPVQKRSPQIEKLDFYELEALALTQILQQRHKLNVEVTASGRVVAPRFIGYLVNRTGALQFKKLVDAEVDLAQEINDIHRNHKFGDVTINFTETQPIWLQISNPRPSIVKWEDRHSHWKPKPLQAFLGYRYEGVKTIPVVIDLKGKDTAFSNGGFFGRPGAGKSRLMQAALDSMLEVTPPTMLNIWGIESSGETLKPYVNLPHTIERTSKIDRAMEILQMFADWCLGENAPNDDLHRLLVIDEFQDLMTDSDHGKAALKLVSDILSKGRKFNIRVWVATQNPDELSYPAILKPKTHFTACCYILYDGYVKKVMEIKGASKIVEKEEFIYKSKDGEHRSAMLYYPDDEQAATISALEAKWCVRRSAPPAQPTAPPRENYVAPVAPLETISSLVAPGAQVAPASNLGPNAKWNLPTDRAPTPAEAAIIVQMVRDADPSTGQFHYRGKPSQNKVIEHVYGKKGGKVNEWIGDIMKEAGLI